MENILQQQADSLKKLEELSVQDRALQAVQTAKLLGVDADGDRVLDETKLSNNILDKGFKSLNDNITKQAGNLLRIKEQLAKDQERMEKLFDKFEVPLSPTEKVKERISNLNPLNIMGNFVNKLKDTFSTEKGRYIRSEAQKLREINPTLTSSEAMDKAKADYNEMAQFQIMKRKRDEAIKYGRDMPQDVLSFMARKGAKSDSVSTSEEEREALKISESINENLEQIVTNTKPVEEKPKEEVGPKIGLLGGLIIGGLVAAAVAIIKNIDAIKSMVKKLVYKMFPDSIAEKIVGPKSMEMKKEEISMEQESVGNKLVNKTKNITSKEKQLNDIALTYGDQFGDNIMTSDHPQAARYRELKEKLDSDLKEQEVLRNRLQELNNESIKLQNEPTIESDLTNKIDPAGMLLGDVFEKQSKEVESIKSEPVSSGANVINAPSNTTINSSKTQIQKLPDIKNTDKSINRYYSANSNFI